MYAIKVNSMNLKVILKFILGLILSVGLFTVSIYLTDLLNDRLPLYVGIVIISTLSFLIKRKKIKPLTYGFLVGFIPIAIIIAIFTAVSSLH